MQVSPTSGDHNYFRFAVRKHRGLFRMQTSSTNTSANLSDQRPELDIFASRLSAQLLRLTARKPDPYSKGTDAM